MELGQIQTPALILDLDALDANQKQMDAVVSGARAKLRPHYKSHKCTAIAKMQMQAGAKGITCAKLGEARDLAEAGIEDILIANQITDKGRIAAAASLAGCCRLSVAVDQRGNILDLEAAAAYYGTVIHCLVEYEIGMARCGVDTPEEAYRLARTVMDCPHLVFEGIQAYAGHLSHEPSKAVRAETALRVESRLRELKAYLENHGCPVREISGCSTATAADHAFADSVYTEFQAGSYLFMDAAYRGLRDLPFQNSMFVLTSVMSRSGPRTVMDAGIKAVSSDQAPPLLRDFDGCPVILSEEHSQADIPGAAPEIGEKLLMLPGHCCTCFNLYDAVYFVRGGRVVNKVPITSRGKSW